MHGLSAARRQGAKQRLLTRPLHAGKAGGPSVETTAPSLAQKANRALVSPAHAHFDWPHIDKSPQDEIDVIALLRRPASRAASQPRCAKALKWTRSKPAGKMSLGEHLNDTNEMMKTRSTWVGGQAATWWSTGAQPR